MRIKILLLMFVLFGCKKKETCWRVVNWWYHFPSNGQVLIIAKGTEIDTVVVNRLYNLGDLYCR